MTRKHKQKHLAVERPRPCPSIKWAFRARECRYSRPGRSDRTSSRALPGWGLAGQAGTDRCWDESKLGLSDSAHLPPSATSVGARGSVGDLRRRTPLRRRSPSAPPVGDLRRHLRLPLGPRVGLCLPPEAETCPRKSPFNTIPNQSKFQCFSRPCASFRTSSILVASIRVLASMRALSCSACPWFGAVTCVSHVLRCARARVVPFAV